MTLPECLEENKEKHENTIFYVTDEVQQGQYIRMFKEEGTDAVILKHNIDQPFITHLNDTFKEEVSEDDKKSLEENQKSLAETFKKALNNENLELKLEKLKDEKISAMVTLSEESRRMQEMMKMYGMAGMDPSMFGSKLTLVLNANHPLVQYILENKDSENVPMMCEQLYDLAVISHEQLSPEAMTKFIERTNKIMELLVK